MASPAKQKTMNLKRGLYILIFLGVLLRLMQAVLNQGLIYPDEQFQTLEPAWHLAGGAFWQTSEWTLGMRSWILPSLYWPLFKLLRVLGIETGFTAIAAARLMTLLLVFVSMWQFYKLLVKRNFSDLSILLIVFLYALLPAQVVWSTSTFSESWSLISIWITMPYLLNFVETSNPNKRHLFFAGTLLGLPVLFRYPSLVWIFFFWIVWIRLYKPSLKNIFLFSAGAASPFFLQGLVDWVSWGHPFHSLIQYVRYNFIEGVASGHGTLPFYGYLQLLTMDLGLVTTAVLLLIFVFCSAAKFYSFRNQDKLILWSAAGYVFVHSLIGHKEMRFLLPVYPVLFYFLALSLDALMQKSEGLQEDILSFVNKKGMTSLCALLSFFLAFQSWQSIREGKNLDPSDMSDLGSVLYSQIQKESSASKCVALFETSFIWTRGRQYFGKDLQVKELTFQELKDKPQIIDHCDYSLVAVGGKNYFAQLSSQSKNRWTLVAVGRFGHSLFVRAP